MLHATEPNHKTGFSFRPQEPGEADQDYNGRVSKAKARHGKQSGQARAADKFLRQRKQGK